MGSLSYACSSSRKKCAIVEVVAGHKAPPSKSTNRTPMSSPGIEPGPRPSQGRMRIRHTPRTYTIVIHPVPRRGIEPRLAASNAAVLIRHTRKALCFSSIPTWIRTRARTFGGSDAIRYTIGIQVHARADDWIPTSINLFTRQAPFSVEPRRQARARGVEPRPSALETDCSPRSTLV